jgi:hypothetical protein
VRLARRPRRNERRRPLKVLTLNSGGPYRSRSAKHEIWLPACIAPPHGHDFWLEILRRSHAYLQGSGITSSMGPDGVQLRGVTRPICASDLSLILCWLKSQAELRMLEADETDPGEGDGS